MEITRTRSRVSIIKIGIVILTLATALIHLYLAVTTVGDILTTVMFSLNFLAYVTLLAAYFLPFPFLRRYHTLVRYALMALAVVTIVLWLIMGMRIPLAYVDKSAEVLLVVLLLLDR